MAATLIAGAGLTFLLAREVYDLTRRNPHAFGFKRQTPQWLGSTRRGVVMWGIDIGIPFSTYRASLLPLTGVLAVGTSLIPWWYGLVYASTFLLAIWLGFSTRRDSSNLDAVFGFSHSTRDLLRPIRMFSLPALLLLAVAIISN